MVTSTLQDQTNLGSKKDSGADAENDRNKTQVLIDSHRRPSGKEEDTKTVLTPTEKNQLYDLQTFGIMRRVLTSKSNCVDVGCHVGCILREMIRLAPEGTHYAFEPIPELFVQLKELFNSHQNVKLYEIGLTNATSESAFHHVISNPQYSGFRRRRYDRPSEKIKEIRVRTDTLDNIIPKDILIHFIKIDVEGAELQVLQGAVRTIKNNRPIIVFEHGRGAADFYGTSPEDVYYFLTLECSLKISLMVRWLKDESTSPLDRDEFVDQFRRGENYYFVAHP